MQPRTYAEFWPIYVGAHRHPVSRGLHYLGTSMALSAFIYGLASGTYLWMLVAPLLGYGPAWFAHFVVEGNRPATFGHPLWSLASDFRMLSLALRGRMADEVIRLYGSANPPPDAPLRVRSSR